jgi:hypothetical protein
VAAGVIDDLELVDVDVTQRIRRLARLGTAQRALEPCLELATIDQTRSGCRGSRGTKSLRFSSRLSLTSWNTSTPPEPAPEPSRIGEAVLSMYISLPSRLISSVGAPT